MEISNQISRLILGCIYGSLVYVYFMVDVTCALAWSRGIKTMCNCDQIVHLYLSKWKSNLAPASLVFLFCHSVADGHDCLPPCR